MKSLNDVAAISELTTRPAGLLAIAVIGVKSSTRSNEACLFWMRSMVCATEMATPMVWPSGAARLSAPMPSAPDAPARFSTTTGWRRLSLSFCPIARALMSPAPPGGFGTMMRIARVSCACAHSAKRASAQAESGRLRFFILQRPLAVAQPRQHALLVQGVKGERDLAAVAAAERLHELRKEHRPARERGAHVVVAFLAVEARRARPACLDRLGNAVGRG